MKSLHDELDDSADTTLTLSNMNAPDHSNMPSFGESLASELEDAMAQRSAESPSDGHGRIGRRKKRSPGAQRFSKPQSETQHVWKHAVHVPSATEPFDYSGDEWGDPADDSDPDGRFASLDGAIDDFVECINLDLDSAYESQEEELATGDCLQRLVDGLHDLPSQSKVELALSNFINLHKSIIVSVQLRVNELRDVAQAAAAVADETILEDTRNTLEIVMQTIPAVDISLWNELLLIEAENNALIADLSLLNDSLQIARQISTQAQKSLRSARDNVDQWKADIAGIDESKIWLEKHGWDDKLNRRSTAHELLTISRGFEQVCAETRKQITAMS